MLKYPLRNDWISDFFKEKINIFKITELNEILYYALLYYLGYARVTSLADFSLLMSRAISD